MIQLKDINEVGFSEIIKAVNELDESNSCFLPLKIAFLRNVTVDLFLPFLKYHCYSEDIRPIVHMGEYGTVIQEVMNDTSEFYKFSPDFVILCLKLETLSEKLSKYFSGMNADDIQQETERILGTFERIIDEVRKRTSAVLLVHNFEVPVNPSFGVLDYQNPDMQVNTVRRINLRLIEVTSKYKGVYIIDTDALQSRVGHNNYFDRRCWHIGRAPYARAACKAITGEYMKIIRAAKGKAKKCLILDCDNTLWGGIIGEDGIAKIAIGKTYPGISYRDFQESILNLHNRGVILTICSKNNDNDVLEVLEEHPDMVLRKEHFSVMKINWEDKATNIRAIAQELNIGLDSMVFVDDSDFEVNLVRQRIPEVTTIQLPKDPTAYRDWLDSFGKFDSLSYSKEDGNRNRMYQQEVGRKQIKAQFSEETLDDYYKYLEMEVTISTADKFSIPRVSQLTHRTNQFNLTTRRYSEAEIKELCESGNSDVLQVRLKDRFGDDGIVGAAVLRYSNDECHIDIFLLSCRILGRGVEDALLRACVLMAQGKGCAEILGSYLRTKKNVQVRSFYENHLFSIANEGEDRKDYSFSLNNLFPGWPEYFKTIEFKEA